MHIKMRLIWHIASKATKLGCTLTDLQLFTCSEFPLAVVDQP